MRNQKRKIDIIHKETLPEGTFIPTTLSEYSCISFLVGCNTIGPNDFCESCILHCDNRTLKTTKLCMALKNTTGDTNSNANCNWIKKKDHSG